MDRTLILVNLAKLNKSQRDRMRNLCATPLQALTVTQRGWVAEIVAESCGFQHTVYLGPRGRKMHHVVREI
jgi:uncharacterized protein YecT (DUF1311 family)